MGDRILFDACPLCGCKDLSHAKTASCAGHALYDSRLSATIVWKRCSTCLHVFTEGYYTEDATRILFGRTHENQKVGALLEQNRVTSARMIEKVLPYASSGTWLDVGFGNGSLLFTAEEYGFMPIGVDLRRDNVEMMRELGVEAHCLDLTSLALEEKCAVVSLADVLEHMPYPKSGLVAANRLLQDQGVLLVSMPNTENIIWDALDEQGTNPYWGEIEHYHNFSRTRLYSLLEEHGFRVMRYGISERYRICMEVVARKIRDLAAAG